MYIYMHLYVCVYIYIYVYVYVYICISLSIHIYIYIDNTYVCVYKNIYIYIYIYTHLLVLITRCCGTLSMEPAPLFHWRIRRNRRVDGCGAPSPPVSDWCTRSDTFERIRVATESTKIRSANKLQQFTSAMCTCACAPLWRSCSRGATVFGVLDYQGTLVQQ